MRRRGLVAVLALPVFLLALAGTAIVAALVLPEAERAARHGVEERLRAEGSLAAAELTRLSAWGPQAADLLAARAPGSASRLTVIGPDGQVFADTDADAALMESHRDRPEVRDAFRHGVGIALRRSRTVRAELLYVAVASHDASGGIRGVVRAALPAEQLTADINALRARTMTAAVAVGLLTALAGLAAAAIASRTLGRLSTAAERIAAGELDGPVPSGEIAEVARLAHALDAVASGLRESTLHIGRKSLEQDAVLSSMSEGVLAVDDAGRVLSLNEAAARLIGTSRAQAEGRRLQEVIRHPELEQLVRSVLASGRAEEGEIVLGDGGERFVQVHGTVLRDGAGQGTGAVVVLNDLTRLRQLESVRREFVANVSHELKTPVTSIKGFVETLREGAMNDPARAERFLGIISRQAERLSSIIEDLLTLSRLEQEGDPADIPMTVSPLRALLESAAQVCELQATERGTPIRVTCDPHLVARINPPLLEQAVVNLVDNAIKHSEPDAPIDILAERVGDDLVIAVVDSGVGIEPEHLPRLFERFYRVDRARSRKAGGTGLGLSIVKHIAQAHGGTATVSSVPGGGSTFRVTIPAGTEG